MMKTDSPLAAMRSSLNLYGATKECDRGHRITMLSDGRFTYAYNEDGVRVKVHRARSILITRCGQQTSHPSRCIRLVGFDLTESGDGMGWFKDPGAWALLEMFGQEEQ